MKFTFITYLLKPHLPSVSQKRGYAIPHAGIRNPAANAITLTSVSCQVFPPVAPDSFANYIINQTLKAFFYQLQSFISPPPTIAQSHKFQNPQIIMWKSNHINLPWRQVP